MLIKTEKNPSPLHVPFVPAMFVPKQLAAVARDALAEIDEVKA